MSKAALAVNGHAELFDLRNEAAPSAKEHGSSKKQLKISALPINAILKDEMHAVVAQPERETPAFFVADVAEVLAQLKRWRKALPRIHPFMHKRAPALIAPVRRKLPPSYSWALNRTVLSMPTQQSKPP